MMTITKNPMHMRMRRREGGVMKGVHTALTILVWSMCMCLEVSAQEPPPQPPKLPFHFITACGNNNNHDNLNGTTLLLFNETRSSTPFSYSSCRCNVSSHAPLYLTRLWPQETRGSARNVNITIRHRNTTRGFDNGLCPLLGRVAGGGCYWNTSQDYPGLSIVMTVLAEEERDTSEEDEEEEEDEGLKGNEAGASLVLLAVQGQGAVDIQCSSLPTSKPTQQPSTLTTARSQTTTNTSHGLKETTPPSSHNTSMAEGGGGGRGGDDSAPNETEAQGNSSSNGVNRIMDQDGNREAQGIHFDYLVLGIGVLLILIAVLAIIIFVFKQRNKTKQAGADDEESAHRHNRASHSSKGRKKDGTTTATATSSTTAGARNGSGSRDSLLNDNHNYEEVSEDGLEGGIVGVAGAGVGVRKISNVSMATATTTTSNYSRIQAAAPPSASAVAPRRNTTPTLPNTSTNNDDYSHLDLSGARRLHAARPQGQPAAPPAARNFYVSEEDEYMDVNDDGDNDGDDDNDNDIYEAVDGGDADLTPLCPRRGEGGGGDGGGYKQEYTDCVSSDDGKLRPTDSAGGNAKKTSIHSGGGAKQQQASKPDTRPTLPTSPPPSLPSVTPTPRSLVTLPLTTTSTSSSLHPAKLGTGGLKRHTSRSVENLAVRDKYRGAPNTRRHSHSKSLDLHHHHQSDEEEEEEEESLCRQRDLFLQRFRSQGDGAEADPAGANSGEGDYSDVRFPAREGSHDQLGARLQAASASPEPASQAIPEAPGSQRTAEPVQMRRKSRGSSKKKKAAGAGAGVEGPLSMVQKFKELNSEILQLESAVRHSMEIKEDEFVMFDNILYDTLPRDLSLPTTEL